MSTFFYGKRKWYVWFSACITGIFSAVAFVYACWISTAEKVENARSFYFVVADSQHVQASAYTIVLDGGAGYAVESNGSYYAAYAVYFSKEKASEVAFGLQESGEQVKLVEKETQALYFKTRKEKRERKKTVNMLENLYACMLRIQEEIERLERGATQQSSVKRTRAIVEQLCFLANANEVGDCAECAKACRASAKRLEEYTNGVIYAKNLRFELCQLSDLYLKTCEIFYL